MKIGLTQTVLDKSADFSYPYTLAVISAWLKKTMPETEVIYSTDISTLLKCDEIWCTSTSDAWNKVNELGKIIIKEEKKFIVGGHHATALPHTLKYGEAFRGPLERYSHIDELPLPDWSIFPHDKKYVMMTSRGCPYRCHFCSSSYFWKTYQARSPEKVIEEIRQLYRLGTKEIMIFDDLFTVNRERLENIVFLIEKEQLNQIEYSCLVRSNTIDKNIINLLRRMNVKHLAFGAESGSNRMLELMSKKATVESNQRAIDILNDYGLRPTISLIVGYPGETLNDIELTRQFIEINRRNCDIIEIYPCIPFPGTKLWNWFVEHYSVKVDKFDWESLTLNLSNIDWDKYHLLTDNYPKKELVNFIKWNEDEKTKMQEDKMSNFKTVNLIKWQHGEVKEIKCPVCKDSEDKKFILRVRNLYFSYPEWLDLYRCKFCYSYFYNPIEVPSYKKSIYDTKSIKHYVEMGAGIDSIIAPIFKLRKNKNIKSLLDIGCGFGFSLDFVSKMFGWESVGFEPSESGRVGAELLQTKIYNEYVQDVKDMERKKFDVVFSSEVIEHIPDPKPFLILLKNYLSENGILVMTTPNVDYIRADTQFPRLLAILFPAFHLILFSPRGIKIMLRNAGFKKIKLIKNGSQIIVYASNSKVSFDEDPNLLREMYVDYLNKFVVKKHLKDSLYDGITYRLFKERVNRGEYEEARRLLPYIRESLEAKYGIEILVAPKMEEFIKVVDTFERLGDISPYNLAPLYYYLGILNLNHFADYNLSALLFKHAFEISLKMLSLEIGYFVEVVDLLWRMKYHEGLSYLYHGKSKEALEIFSFILANKEKKLDFFFISPPQDVIVKCYFQVKEMKKRLLSKEKDITIQKQTGSIHVLLVYYYYKVRDKVLPRGTKRREFFKRLFIRISHIIKIIKP